MVGSTVSMFDIHVLCMSTYGPRYVRKSYLGKVSLRGLIPIFRTAFFVWNSPTLPRAQSSELLSNEPRGIIKAQAISRFLGLELRCS